MMWVHYQAISDQRPVVLSHFCDLWFLEIQEDLSKQREKNNKSKQKGKYYTK